MDVKIKKCTRSFVKKIIIVPNEHVTMLNKALI